MTRRRPRTPWPIRALLRLLPGEFRGDFGDALTADLDEARAGRSAPGFWLRETPSLVAAVIREHDAIAARDVRYALRTLGRTPAFTALAILMLALGTGANVAMFSVVDAVLLRTPFADADRLVWLRGLRSPSRQTPALKPDDVTVAASFPQFSSVTAMGSGAHVLTGLGDPERLDVECVGASMFATLGSLPRIGRTFGADEDRPRSRHAVFPLKATCPTSAYVVKALTGMQRDPCPAGAAAATRTRRCR